jgi:hypothetical protein
VSFHNQFQSKSLLASASVSEQLCERKDGVVPAGPVPRRRPEEGQHKAERRQSGVAVRGAGEEAAQEAVEERHGAAEARRGDVRVRPGELLPELRRRPLPLVATSQQG